MRKINDQLSIGTKLTMSDIQMFAIKSIDQDRFLAYDENNNEFYFTDDVKLAERFEGDELVVELEEIMDILEKECEDTFSVVYIGSEWTINYGVDY